MQAAKDSFYMALRERLAIARSNRDAAQKILEAVQARFDAGVASPTELASQKAALYTAQIAIADLVQLEMEARAALALLLGRPPENFEVRGDAFRALVQALPGLQRDPGSKRS